MMITRWPALLALAILCGISGGPLQAGDLYSDRDAPKLDPATLPRPADIRSLTIYPTTIKLKGVEISDCDVLVVEGEVEATVNSKAMQIAEPGTLKGQVTIDVAEIFGDFSGELTARTKLIVHGKSRNECLMRLRRALDEYVIGGIETTIPLHQRLTEAAEFIDGDYDVPWLEYFTSRLS